MKIKYLTLFFSVFIFLSNTYIQSQSVLDSIRNNSPIAKKIDRDIYWHIGFMLGPSESDSVAINYGTSWRYGFGQRTAFKFKDNFAVGMGFNYKVDRYRIAQNNIKAFPDTSRHDKEQFISNGLYIDFYPRFYLDKKVDAKMRRYLDIGLYGEYEFTMKHRTVNEFESVNAQGAKEVHTEYHRLEYANRWQFGAIVRLGLGPIGIFGVYRFNDLFKKDTYADLPKLIVGVQLERLSRGGFK